VTEYFYEACGLQIASSMPLRAFVTTQRTTPASPVIRFYQDDVPAALCGAAQSGGPNWECNENQFLLRVPGIAKFLIENGATIRFQPEPGVSLDDVSAFLVGSALGILIHQRGQIILHASSVLVNGKAVLFCGASGKGKSTLAAALDKRGFPVVTDDFCVLDPTLPPSVFPDGRYLRLWQQSLDGLDMEDADYLPVRRKINKYYVSPENVVSDPVPLGPIYILRETKPPFTSGIAALNLTEAATAIRQQAYRPFLIQRMAKQDAYFLATMRMMTRSEAFTLTRPMGFAALPKVLDQLQAHWREVGLV